MPSYNAAVLDIKSIREQPDSVRRRLATRGAGDEAKIDKLLKLDEILRQWNAEIQKLNAQLNKTSKEIGALMTQKRTTEAEEKKAEARQIGDKIAKLQSEKKALEGGKEGDTISDLFRRSILLELPNLPHETVPEGKDAQDNRLVRTWGEKSTFSFKPKPHIDLCESLKLVDFARGAKLSGSGFLLFTGWGARLERALIQFLLDLHITHHGYTEVSPPFIVGRHCMEGVGQFPKFVDQSYAVRQGVRDFDYDFDEPDEEDQDEAEAIGVLKAQDFLVPTAEAPVVNIHREEILKESQLPIRYVAYSPCFRAEAGAAGVGTRGMIRVHQFDKVELIKIVKPEHSYDELEKMVADAERVLQSLGLHYRVVLLCTGDMGFASAKTYDIEVWAPGQGSYLEVSSCSNCEDFQARRMNLRFKTEAGENRFPHILNGSGTALARLFVALVETFQQTDGSISIPAALQPYLKADRITA